MLAAGIGTEAVFFRFDTLVAMVDPFNVVTRLAHKRGRTVNGGKKQVSYGVHHRNLLRGCRATLSGLAEVTPALQK